MEQYIGDGPRAPVRGFPPLFANTGATTHALASLAILRVATAAEMVGARIQQPNQLIYGLRRRGFIRTYIGPPDRAPRLYTFDERHPLCAEILRLSEDLATANDMRRTAPPRLLPPDWTPLPGEVDPTYELERLFGHANVTRALLAVHLNPDLDADMIAAWVGIRRDADTIFKLLLPMIRDRLIVREELPGHRRFQMHNIDKSHPWSASLVALLDAFVRERPGMLQRAHAIEVLRFHPSNPYRRNLRNALMSIGRGSGVREVSIKTPNPGPNLD